MKLVLGTRGSKLAVAQSSMVARMIEASGDDITVELQIISTKGDRIRDRPLREIGGKGLFTAELEAALRDGSIHLAVHSLKDLPTEDAEGLMIGAVPVRADARAVLVGCRLEDLPQGARVGTGSARREVQLRTLRPDLDVVGIRGNVDTRLRKALDGEVHAVVLAEAGLARLGVETARHPLDPERFIPAPGQGALGVQCAWSNAPVRDVLRGIEHAPTRLCVNAERAFLARLGGGCSVPAGAWATLHKGRLRLKAMLATKGVPKVVELEGGPEDAVLLGEQAADQLA